MRKMTLLLLFSVGVAFAQNSTNKIKFTAKIANRNSDTLVIKGANKFRHVIPIDKKELFTATFDAPKGFYQFSDGTEVSSLYLKPGSDINLTMNAKEFDETIVYKGKGTNESNFLAQSALNDEKFENEAFSKETVEFATLLEAKIKTDLANIDKGDFDPEFKEALKRSVEQSNAYAKEAYEIVSKTKRLNGKASPVFDYENYKGGKTKLADLKGKYVYIDLWATWCAPCRAEIPFLQKTEEKYHGENIEFVSISVDKAKDYEKWKKFVNDKKLGGTQLFADRDWESDFVVGFGVTGIPRFILIDPKGNVLNADAPRPSSPELQVVLDKLLN
ncbi:TlpA family protein disulfide reductase [Flavobacterium sp. LS1R49]|uniref:TlpA family protein disulfide reductase n=1 Tax=Flavobacterium shii TaxID=2987687 RepID=A0A9X2ZER4_9FLAO|nr:TlpA disulfide reductase family protein [Flavobacterium shii]MCV9928035.1 TlpA family protein disulfide reductase [Flavobacterium shii]